MLDELTCPEKKQNISKTPDSNCTTHYTVCMKSSLHAKRGLALCSESEIHPALTLILHLTVSLLRKIVKTMLCGYLQIRRKHRVCFSPFSVKVGSFSNFICPSVDGQNSTLSSQQVLYHFKNYTRNI